MITAAWHTLASEVGAFVRNVGALAKLDAELLKSELRQSGVALGIIGGAFAAALVLALCAFVSLIVAVGLFLIELGLRPSVAAVCVTVFFLVFTAAAVAYGLARIRTWTIVPRRTIGQVKLNIAALKASLSNDRLS